MNMQEAADIHAKLGIETYYKHLPELEKFNYITSMLHLIQKHELFMEIMWTEDLTFWILCNDVFTYGADGEDIEPEDVSVLSNILDVASANKIDLHEAMMYFISKKHNNLQPVKHPYTEWDKLETLLKEVK